MLLQFSVENYKSFKERTVLSLEASTDKELENNVTRLGKDKVLNSAAVFGANAAGKSNLFQALTAALLTIRQSNSKQLNERMELIVPFRFDPECAGKPTAFEFVFIAEGKKYVYGFAASGSAVTEEYLYVYNSSKPSLVFERTECCKYRFASTSSGIKRELKPIVERNTDNKLFLATATAWNCASTRIPYLWLSEKIDTYSNNTEELFPFVMPMYEEDGSGELKEFTKRILHEAGMNIDDYEITADEISGEDVLRFLPKQLQGMVSTLPSNGRAIRIDTTHSVELEDGVREYRLSMKDESQGTKNIFMFSPVLKRALDRGETLCVDEFDANMHPLLVLYLLRLFNNPNINRSHAQLIVSTHSMELLSLKNLRRDQIYFVEKNRRSGASELYSLDEYSPRKDENVRKAYLQGRYGSVPAIPEEAYLWD